MANRNLAPVAGSLCRGLVLMEGLVSIAAGGAVSSDSIPGAVASKPAGTGLYRLTLEDKFNELKSCNVTAESVTGEFLHVQVKVHDVVSAKTIDIQVLDAAGAALDPVAACKIHVALRLKNSSVTP